MSDGTGAAARPDPGVGSAGTTRPRPSAAGPAPTSSALERRADTDPGERGSLTLADRVVEKVAAKAATEVSDTVELPPRLSERLPGRRTAGARAQAVTSGRLVQLQVRVGISYPVSVVGVTRAVRQHVGETVGRLCDVEVRDVDVVVSRLSRPRRERRRVL